MKFLNREDAGRKLAEKLMSNENVAHADKGKIVVLALPRGGVPVAFEIAKRLSAPLDVLPVRKLGVPGHSELAMGAIAGDGVCILNDDVINHLRIPSETIEQVEDKENKELARRNQLYRGAKPAPDLNGKTVILVDDGMATGANMQAAIQAAKKQHAARILVATPVSSGSAYATVGLLADRVVTVGIPNAFYGVGQFYEDFSQTSDNEVMTLLEKSRSFH